MAGRLSLLCMSYLTLIPGLSTSTWAANTTQHPVVIELFTSQGCSSCPPADKVLQDLAVDPNVIAMSFPVTYWDYLGWKDTLARPENTQRQRAYAAKKFNERVYTPQAVINGTEECVGSDRSKIISAIKASSSVLDQAAVAIDVKRDGKNLFIDLGQASGNTTYRSGTLWLASLSHTADVNIKAGENANRHVSYSNVVRKLTDLGRWKGEASHFSIPIDSEAMQVGDRRVVFLQMDNLGPIVAAAKIDP